MAHFILVGNVLALIFTGLPFVVRTVQLVLEEVERDIEEACALLGAGRVYRNNPYLHAGESIGAISSGEPLKPLTI